MPNARACRAQHALKGVAEKCFDHTDGYSESPKSPMPALPLNTVSGYCVLVGAILDIKYVHDRSTALSRLQSPFLRNKHINQAD